jgi:hypothetical protein
LTLVLVPLVYLRFAPSRLSLRKHDEPVAEGHVPVPTLKS